jgi:hypothetical protein
LAAHRVKVMGAPIHKSIKETSQVDLRDEDEKRIRKERRRS